MYYVLRVKINPLETIFNFTNKSRWNLKKKGQFMMVFFKSLEPQEFDRAGVKHRTYKNSVYKIRNKDSADAKPVYVVAEGASPLKTFYEVIKMDAKMSREYRIFYIIHVGRI